MSVKLRNTRVVTLCIVVLLILTGLSFSATASVPGHQELTQSETMSPVVKTMVSRRGILFTLRYDPNRELVDIHGKNPTTDTISTPIDFRVDGNQLWVGTLSIKPGTSWERSWNVSSHIDVLEPNHRIYLATSGNDTAIKFHRTIDTLHPGKYPVPRITGLELTKEKVGDRWYAALDVTIENPSQQDYHSWLMLHTPETTGERRISTTPANSSRVIRIYMRDDPSERIHGELRLYYENVSNDDGNFAQYEFSGIPGQEFEADEETFEPIEGPWADDPYRYRAPKTPMVRSLPLDSVPKSYRSHLAGVSDFQLSLAVVAALLVAWFAKRHR